METTSHDDMHAGELETSVLLYLAPDLVGAGNETGDWDAADRPLLLSNGMTAYTKTGVIGRPSLGSASKGQLLMGALVELFREHVRRLDA
jgi:creatinine amidohydrolase